MESQGPREVPIVIFLLILAPGSGGGKYRDLPVSLAIDQPIHAGGTGTILRQPIPACRARKLVAWCLWGPGPEGGVQPHQGWLGRGRVGLSSMGPFGGGRGG